MKTLAAQIKIFCVRPEEFKFGFEHRDDFTEILKRHWGYDTFRTFKVYDLPSLDKGEKNIRDVSQEQIISDIVQQVENCMAGDDIQDIFVTAPTGAGKSVIFQIPAIYLAEKYNLLTIVISPLIGLMNDQVKNLTLKNYRQAETINSDISPILKEQIVEKITSGACDIFYISPETLLSRSDVEQLIGDRTIGLVVIDEAHIVTTWGKQFRPDYWYLGDHIKKLRKIQSNRKGHSFIIATFTATAIYQGVEDMYNETIAALHLREPITYLGYVKRGDIEIKIDKTPFDKGERAEFDLEKFSDIENAIKRAKFFRKKTLIYFPEVQLIETAKIILQNKNNLDAVATYHGKMNRDDKRENYEKFFRGDKLVMLSTKAFGMGIDINDIEIVMHFAPTGNVCDYVQEIGRVTRRNDLRGEALYHYDKKDFKYIKRLHGLSAIKKYQLIAVVKKIYELWSFKRKNNLLLDAENFTYIFDRYADESTSINKVKTALLIIQKDFEARLGFSPLTVRPIPLFSVGFFVINPSVQKNLLNDFGSCLKEIEPRLNICHVNLQMIWEKDFRDKSFPQFKYLIYSKNDDLPFNKKYPIQPALCVEIEFEEDFRAIFKDLFGRFKAAVNKSIAETKYFSIDNLVAAMNISEFKARNICEILIASMDSYRKIFNRKGHSIFAAKTYSTGKVFYLFNTAMRFYFAWVEKIFNAIFDETKDRKLYIADATATRARLANVIIGGSGRNWLDGGKGNDTLIGGKGNDVFIYSKNSGNDVITDYEAGDKIKISGGKISKSNVSGSDVILTVGTGSLTVKDAKGKSLSLIDSSGKSFSSIVSGSSTETVSGGSSKTLKLTNSSKATVTLESGIKTADASKRTKAIKITGNSSANTISGGSKADTLYGRAGKDFLIGNEGNDKIYGQDGKDKIVGGSGNDKLYGGDGNDTLQGGKGNDSLWGGDDDNVFVYAKGDGKDIIFGFEDDDMLKITGAFSASYNRSKGEISFKFGSTSNAITLKNFDTSSFNVNGDIYQISGSKLRSVE